MALLSAKQIYSLVEKHGYDYFDFGCSKGGSLKLGQTLYGGKKGLGIDINLKKVEETIAAGFDAIPADVTQLNQIPDCVDFVIMSHFLEHVDGARLAAHCIRSAVAAARQFVIIQQPWFDADGYLALQRLKLYWSDWHGHPNHMTTLDFYNVLSRLEKVRKWRMYGRNRIADSRRPEVHPLNSPMDQHDYDVALHPPKPLVTFTQPVFRDIVVVVITGDILMKQIMHRTKVDELLFDSDSEVLR